MGQPTQKKPSANAPAGKLPPHLRTRLEDLIADVLVEAMGARDLALWTKALRLIEAADAEPAQAKPIPHGEGEPLAKRMVAQAEATIRFWGACPYDVARCMVMLVSISPFFFELPGAVDPKVAARCWREPGHRDPAHDKACATVEAAIKNKLFNPDRTTAEKVVRATLRALAKDPNDPEAKVPPRLENLIRSWFR